MTAMSEVIILKHIQLIWAGKITITHDYGKYGIQV
jgi:hypothetical protein